jgi:hypothetical protein
MKSSYMESLIRFKDSSVDKSRILSSSSAYLSNSGEIQSIGNSEKVPESERFKVRFNIVKQ